MISLPVDAYIPPILDAARRSRAVVVTAAPGAGKTTRVPPALAADGRVMLLQPRRVAARAIAARIAEERGWTLGREVGWQIRFDRRFSRDTRLLVVTEGILTARLQSDPLLADFQTIVLDEFHERSIHADLGIALAREAWHARDDLRIVVMSATIDADAVCAFLDGCPQVDVPGRLHPIDIRYAPDRTVADAVAELADATSGNVLCFLPGASEIRRAIADIQPALASRALDVLPLHGSLPAAEQDAALATATRRRVIVATNVAETSLTVPGVTAVVDTGRHKVARYDAERGIDSLELERITADSADQRAGRAGRLGPGMVRRLWDERDRLRPHREPEIHRVDLAATVLDVVAWGADPRTFAWFEPPRADRIDAAIALLERLGLLVVARGFSRANTSHGARPIRLTDAGDHVRRLPLHPRLGRMLLAGGGARDVARACALLSERHLLAPRTASTSSDLLAALDRWSELPSHVHRAADAIQAISQSAFNKQQSTISESDFRRAVLAGYPDRVAQRRRAGAPEVRVASGAGATIARESGVVDGEFLVALDVHDAGRPGQMPLVRMASRVEREWLTPTSVETIHSFDAASRRVRAMRVERYDALVLSERPAEPDSDVAAAMLADAWIARGPLDDDRRTLNRVRFAGHDVDLAALIRAGAADARTLDDIALSRVLPPEIVRTLDRDAPDTIAVPSGRRVRLDYNDDGTVSASVKLQELFGLADTPAIGRRRDPVLLSLLAPNGRPVQVTRDLRSFWNRTYPEVRKELRGRYPKHPWPEDPWSAPATHRTKRRGGE